LFMFKFKFMFLFLFLFMFMFLFMFLFMFMFMFMFMFLFLLPDMIRIVLFLRHLPNIIYHENFPKKHIRTKRFWARGAYAIRASALNATFLTICLKF
jgi:hypothetical protein